MTRTSCTNPGRAADIVSVQVAIERGYRPLGNIETRRDLRAMCVRAVDRHGDVVLVAMTDDEWADHVLHSADARAHAQAMDRRERFVVLEHAIQASGRVWSVVSAWNDEDTLS